MDNVRHYNSLGKKQRATTCLSERRNYNQEIDELLGGISRDLNSLYDLNNEVYEDKFDCVSISGSLVSGMSFGNIFHDIQPDDSESMLYKQDYFSFAK